MEDEKEVYSLWGEFLKRSDIYCKYCEFAETNECFDSLKGINWKNDERLAFTVAVTKGHILARCDIPFWVENNGSTDKKQFCSDKRLVDATRLNYIVFRNLYKNNIADRWDEVFIPYLASVKESLASSDKESVSIFSDIDFRDIAKESLRNFTLRHYYGEGEEFEDFIDHLSKEFSTFDIVLFQIDITKSKSTLLKAFSNLLDNLFIPYRDKDVLHKSYIIPTNPIYIDELKRYLLLYDLKKEQLDTGTSNRDIFKKVYPDLEKLDTHEMGIGRSRASKELKYAKRIIQNVERGLFPGPYVRKKWRL